MVKFKKKATKLKNKKKVSKYGCLGKKTNEWSNYIVSRYKREFEVVKFAALS